MTAEDQIKQIADQLKEKLQQVAERAEKGEKAGTEAQNELKGLADTIKKLAADAQEQQKHMDKLDIQSQRGTQGAAGVKSLYDIFEEKLLQAKENGGVLAAIKRKDGIQLDEKAVGNLSTAGSTSGTLFTLPYVLPGIVTPPMEEHIRSYLRTGPTASPLVRYVQMTRGEGGFGMVAEGGTKPQLDYDLAVKDAPARKIAGHMRVPEEMIDDIPFLATMLAVIAMEDLKLKEDDQILYGSGTGENLTGLSVTASALNVPAIFKVPAANLYDVIKGIRLQIRKLKYRPDTAFISPTEYAILTTTKDANGRYLFDNLMLGGNVPTIDGVRLVENVAVADGDIFVGDFGTGAILLDRKQATIRQFDQDRDNAILNLITFVVEERVSFVVPKPQAFVYTTLSAATTAILKA